MFSTHRYGFGLGTSSAWSSHTGAGSLNGGCGTGRCVDVGGMIGPVFVLKSTFIPCNCVKITKIQVRCCT